MSIVFTSPSVGQRLVEALRVADHEDLDLVGVQVLLGHAQDVGLRHLLDTVAGL